MLLSVAGESGSQAFQQKQFVSATEAEEILVVVCVEEPTLKHRLGALRIPFLKKKSPIVVV